MFNNSCKWNIESHFWFCEQNAFTRPLAKNLLAINTRLTYHHWKLPKPTTIEFVDRISTADTACIFWTISSNHSYFRYTRNWFFPWLHVLLLSMISWVFFFSCLHETHVSHFVYSSKQVSSTYRIWCQYVFFYSKSLFHEVHFCCFYFIVYHLFNINILNRIPITFLLKVLILGEEIKH